MRSLFEENAQPEGEKPDADLTLGIGSLLSIFFGVVLICGIFFGFGYSMGRRATHGTAAATPAVPQTPTAESPSDAATKTPDSDTGDGPAAAQTKNAAAAVTDRRMSTASAGEKEATAHAPASDATEPAKPAKAMKVVDPETETASLTAAPAPHRTQQAKPHAGSMGPPVTPVVDAQPTPGHPVMVQIAAVSREEDAEALAGALRKRGFSPQVHGGTSDKFFHVQVGPFTDKVAAETMKQHLLADGYNAIVK